MKLLTTIITLLLIFSVLLGVVLSKEKEALSTKKDTDIIFSWYHLNLELIQKTPKYTPPAVARIFGYTGLALYESLLPLQENGTGKQSMLPKVNTKEIEFSLNKNEVHGAVVAHTVLREMNSYFLPVVAAEYQTKRNRFIKQTEDALKEHFSEEEYLQSELWGKMVAQEIISIAQDDGGAEGVLDIFPDTYIPPVGVGLWQPTPPYFRKALLPYWGENKLFVQESTSCVMEPHPPFATGTESNFYKEALEVYEVAKDLTEEEKLIATFWADDPGDSSTPPGHWITIATNILEKENRTALDVAEVYAKLGMSLSDAFVLAWREKYAFNLIRPVTYIQQYIDESWNRPKLTDAVETPPFPEYPSGHSVQSGAAASVLTHLFGEQYSFIDTTHKDLGFDDRTFSSFFDAADEAAISRLYGGVHYRSGIEKGVDFGVCIGEMHINNL